MSQELSTQQASSFTPAQLALITRTVAIGATKDELAMFLHVAKKSGLDPFLRQIHFVKRGGKATIQVGIDGYRAIADRTGKYAGNDEPEFERSADGELIKASVTVYKLINGQRYAFSASAYWDEYKPQKGQDFMWEKMPHVMLGKVAEALALRKAFPNDLSGLYTAEEMAQSGASLDTSKLPQDEQNAPDDQNIVRDEELPEEEELPVIQQDEEETEATAIKDPELNKEFNRLSSMANQL